MPKEPRKVDTKLLLKSAQESIVLKRERLLREKNERKEEKKTRLEGMLDKIIDFIKMNPANEIPRELFIGDFTTEVIEVDEDDHESDTSYDFTNDYPRTEADHDLGFCPDNWLFSRLQDLDICVCKKHLVVKSIDKVDLGLCGCTGESYFYVKKE